MKTLTFKKIGLATLTAALLVGCGSGGGDSYSASPFTDAPPVSEAQKNQYLAAVNSARAKGATCGTGALGHNPAVPAVAWDDRLYNTAMEHTMDMTSVGHLLGDNGSGTDSDWTSKAQSLGRPSDSYDRLKNNLDDGSSMPSQEIYRQSGSSAFGVVNSWIAGSQLECSYVLSPTVTRMGMAEMNGYWTLTLY